MTQPKSKIKDYTVVHMLSIYSTATGYDIVSYWKSEEFGNWKRKVYKNVSHHTMRRFYALSKNDIDVQRNRRVGWQQHDRIFRNPVQDPRPKVSKYQYSKYDW